MKKLLMMMLMIASVLFFSCTKDEDNKLSKDDATAAFDDLSGNMSMYMDEMQNSDGIVSMKILMGLNNPFNTTQKKSNSSTASVFASIEHFLTPVNPSEKATFGEEPFDFEYWWGTYTWDQEHSMWTVVFDNPDDDSDNKIVINFPSDSAAMGVNDATLTIYDYVEVQVIDGDSVYYNPTSITADLYVKDVKAIDINLDATWITSGEMAGEPTSLDADVYVIPFTFHIDFGHASNTATANAWIKYDNTQIFSVGLGATYQNAEDSIPATLNGSIQLFNVMFSVNANISQMMPIIYNGIITNTLNTDDVIADINDQIDAYVNVDGDKAADIEIASFNLNPAEGELPIDIIFVYNDGTSESAIPYFRDFAADLQDFFKFMDGLYDKK